MTRKKYQSDTYGEALKEVYGQTSSDSEDEDELPPHPDDIWEDITTYLLECKNTNQEWMWKWIDPTFYQNMFDKKPVCHDFYAEIAPLAMPYETRDDLEYIYSHVYNIAHICLGFKSSKRPDYDTVDGMVVELLRERTKYYYVGPKARHRSIVSNKFIRQLQKC